MDENIKREVAQMVKDGFVEHLFDVETARTWAKHQFWPWYFSARKAGRDSSLKAFLAEMPNNYFKTVEQNKKTVLEKHKALADEVDEILAKAPSSPASSPASTPAPAAVVRSPLPVTSPISTIGQNQPPKKPKKR